MKNILQSIYDVIAKFIPGMTIILDHDRIIQFISKPAGSRLGSELVGKSIYDFILPQNTDLAKKSIDCVFTTGEDSYYQCEGYRQNSSTTFYDVHVSAIKHGEQVIAIMMICLDITKQKQTEIALRESEEKFRTVFENTADGILLVEIKTRKFLLANPAMEAITGYTLHELIKLDVSEIHPSKDLPLIMKRFMQQAVGELRLAKNIPVRRKDKTIIYCDINARRVEFSGCKCLIGMFRDATERRQQTKKLESEVQKRTRELQKINEQLQESETRFKTIADFTYDWETWFGPAGNCLYVSPACERITGYPREAFLKNPELMRKLISPSDYDKLLMHNQYSKKSHTMEFQLIDAKGEQHCIEHICQPVCSEDGTYLGRRASNRDVTEKHQANEKIYTQQQQLAKIGRLSAMGEVASNLAHQLNQPLAVISSYAQQLEKKLINNASSSSINGIATKIVKNIKHACDIVQNMRDFCTTGAPHKNKEKINEIIIDTVLLLNKKNLGNNVIEYALIMPSPIVLIDKIQISQLLLNILQNAVDAIVASPKKETKITIKSSINNNMLTILIIDSGGGFSPEIKKHLFEPFFTTKTEGMGIGLAICRSIIEAHGGQLSATSEVGKGSKFKFTLPMC